MITASEPLEYIPRGRHPMSYHPGPLKKEKPPQSLPEEMLLLQRMQNVTISPGREDPTEFYSLREVAIEEVTDCHALMPYVCTEEELYVQGHTAVWSHSLGSSPTSQPFTAFSIERPIKYAFFCPRRFLEPDTMAPGQRMDRDGICVVDDEVLQVYCSNGDTYGAKLECPISAIWPTPYGLLLEKDPARSLVLDTPMPRVFTLPYPTDEMKPALLVSTDIFVSCDYLTRADHRVVFACEQINLVVLYDQHERRHFLCWLRLATDEEKDQVQQTLDACEDGDNDGGVVDEDEQYNMMFGDDGVMNEYPSYFKRQSNVGPSTSCLPHVPPSRTSPLPPFDRFPPEFVTEADGTGNNAHISKPTAAEEFHKGLGSAADNWESLFGSEPFETCNIRQMGFAEPWMPIVPEYSLESIWKEPSNVGAQARRSSDATWSGMSKGEMATVGFLHTDLVGNRYICFLQPDITRLLLVQFKKETKPETAECFALAACAAVSLERLNLFALLDPTGKLMLYSGPLLVGKVHVSGLLQTSFLSSTGSSLSGTSSLRGTSSTWKRSSLLPNVAPYDSKFEEELHLLSPVRGVPGGVEGKVRSDVALLDGTGTRFTIAFGGGITDASGNGRSFRVILPPLADSQLVRRCLVALQHALPKKTAHQFLIRWYGTRNVPGTHAGFSIRQEWTMLQSLLLSAMGRPTTGDIGCTNPERPCPSSEPSPSFVCSLKKRRKRENTVGTDADWKYLLESLAQGERIAAAPKDGTVNSSYKDPNVSHSLYNYIPQVLEVLHLLYEDFKLDTGLAQELRLLGDFLYIVAKDAHASNYEQHYFLDFPELCDQYRTNAYQLKDSTLLNAIKENSVRLPHIFRYLKAIVQARPELSGMQRQGSRTEFVPYPHIAGINDRSRDVTVLVALMFRERRLTPWVQRQLDALLTAELFEARLLKPLLMGSKASEPGRCDVFGNTVLHFLIEQGYTRQELSDLPLAVHFLLQQMLEPLRQSTVHGHDAAVYSLLLRPELHEHAVSAGVACSGSLVSHSERRVVDRERNGERRDQWFTDMAEFDALTGVVSTKEDPQKLEREDGMDNLDVELLQLRFPYDQRIGDVRSFLTSSARVLIDIPQGPNVSDHDFIEEQERRLYSLCLRTMALPIGRGMFTFSTCYQGETELAHIPRLCLTGREPLRGATIEVVQLEVPAHMNLWPTFHNGVAAGLRICPDTPHLSSSWIKNNKHASKRTPPAGNNCPFFPGSEAMVEHGGFLLALGLTGHLRKLSMYNVFDYLVRSNELMRIGTLLGLAAAYRGTEHTRTTCVLAVHVEALLPPTAIELDVTSTLQVAALFGIGLVFQGTAKRHIAQVLLQEIGRPPGPEMENAVDRESYALAAGLALGMVTLGRGEQLAGLRDLAIPGELYHYMNGGTRRMTLGAQREKYKLPSFQICEGDEVNLDVTAPGATLALGLMFFDTSDPTISGWLQPPDTKYLFGFVRPDLLLLRVIARHLICWREVQPTQSWVADQLPQILVDAVAYVEGGEEERSQFKVDQKPNIPRVERELYCQAHSAIVCGSVVGIGLRFAGTADPVAATTLYHYLRYFIDLRHPKPKDANTPAGTRTRNLAKFIGGQVLENCMLMTLLALSLVLAGTGDVRVLRAVRMLRSRVGIPGVTYGSHMAVHMALGFAYLGGGRYTLSRSPPAIAAIVCAIFPKFPVYSNDNRYHLQALRHLYVLAVEPRLFVPRRIDTGKLTQCQIRFATRHSPTSSQTIETRLSPCMLPELHTLEWVEVCDENFYPIRFNAQNWNMLETIMSKRGYIDVVQHVGCLSYLEDPTRTVTMHLQNLPGRENSTWAVMAELLLELPSQPMIVRLAQTLLLPPQRYLLRAAIEPKKNLPDANRALEYFQAVVAHCVTRDRFHVIPILFDLTYLLLDPHNYKAQLPTDTWSLELFKAILGRTIPMLTEEGEVLPGKLLRSLVLAAHGKWTGNLLHYRTVLLNLCGIFFARNTPLFDRMSELSLDTDDKEKMDDAIGGNWPKVNRRTSILTNVARMAVQYELPLDEIDRELLGSLWPQDEPSRSEFVTALAIRHPELSARTTMCLADLLNLRQSAKQKGDQK